MHSCGMEMILCTGQSWLIVHGTELRDGDDIVHESRAGCAPTTSRQPGSRAASAPPSRCSEKTNTNNNNTTQGAICMTRHLCAPRSHGIQKPQSRFKPTKRANKEPLSKIVIVAPRSGSGVHRCCRRPPPPPPPPPRPQRTQLQGRGPHLGGNPRVDRSRPR